MENVCDYAVVEVGFSAAGTLHNSLDACLLVNSKHCLAISAGAVEVIIQVLFDLQY